jgi:putative sterol carrier protein
MDARPAQLGGPVANRINSCKEYFDTLDDRFNSEASKGVDAIYQFELKGDGGGVWHVVVAEGAISVCEGEHAKPSAVVTSKAPDFVKISNGDINGLRAVMTRKMKIAGNLVLARKMQHMFPSGNI